MSSSDYPRLLAGPHGSFFLFGARGMGKSTWARSQFPGAVRFDLLDERRHHELMVQPGLFAAELRALGRGQRVVMDEVQRLPGLLHEVHRAIEELGLKFVLLGSSARKLKTAGTNLLAGRAVRCEMFPFVPEELGRDFDLERTLRFGALPLVWRAEDPVATLESYVQLYLKEEVRAEALVRNLPGFARFLPVAALLHGQVINVSSLARDAGAPRMTVMGYLEILEDTLLAFRLPAFEARLRVRERKHPKLYWIDPGLVRALKRQLSPLALEERGALFEGWVAGLLRAYQAHRRLCDALYYWAPGDNTAAEVDFILERGHERLALEVKSTDRFRPEHLAGLRQVAGLKGLTRRVLVYLGERTLKPEDNIEVWPLARFLEALAGNELWP